MDDETVAQFGSPQPMKHQLVKFVLGTTAGFVIGKLVERAYDAVYNKTNSTTADPEQ